MAQQKATLRVEVVTATGSIFTGDADEVVAPGGDGQLGILPRHAPLLTTLTIGALHIKRRGTEQTLYIGGGFMEVYHDLVTILADDAQRAETIDEAQAEEARHRAETLLAQRVSDVDRTALVGEIERSLGRLRVAEIRRQRSGRRNLPPSEP
jgi:F-type H+-transporting ATPase subunit epsilon